MVDGNRNGGRSGDEYEEENGHEDRDSGGNGSVKVDKNGEEARGEREHGNLLSYSRGGAKDTRV